MQEKIIERENDIVMTHKVCREIASDSDSNRVARVVLLRKLCELNELKNSWGYAYQILSSLIHGKSIKQKIANGVYTDMNEEHKTMGLELIKQFISDFQYDNELINTFNEAGVKEIYRTEQNNYYKLLLFRELTELCPNIRLQPRDDGWFKYVDETYHIENDNLHYLDIRKFEIVPDFIINNIDKFMA